MKSAVLICALLGSAVLAFPVVREDAPPETVVVAPGDFRYRPAGQYRLDGRVVDPPAETRGAATPLVIMRHQVSRAEYARCVADDACAPAPAPGQEGYAQPQTGVSWQDATAYADWLSERTGQNWRLPTDAEWVRAAAERAVDEGLETAGSDPAARWLAQYGQNVDRRAGPDLEVRPQGAFGVNSNGLADMAGNVWEWTSTCSRKIELAADGARLSDHAFCGVRVVQGQHRAEIVDFVRDARAGGCAVGLPPDHLGFRLVLG